MTLSALVLASLAMVGAPAAATPPVCPAFTWTTLGTAGGPVPTPERSEPANLLVADGHRILVDTGDGTVDQLARKGMALGGIEAVFISHHHLDHTGGLAAVIGLRWMNQFPGVLTVYGPPGTKEMVDELVASMRPQARIGFGLGHDPTPPAASVRVVEVRGGDTVTIGDLAVRAVANSHFDHPGPVAANAPQSLSYRFQLGGRAITFTGDTGPSAAVATLAQGSDLLVSEVIDLDRMVAAIQKVRTDASPQMLADMRRHLGTHHLNADAVGAIAGAARVGRIVLTHFAIPPGPLSGSEAGLRAGIAAHFAGSVDLATDLATFTVPCR